MLPNKVLPIPQLVLDYQVTAVVYEVQIYSSELGQCCILILNDILHAAVTFVLHVTFVIRAALSEEVAILCSVLIGMLGRLGTPM